MSLSLIAIRKRISKLHFVDEEGVFAALYARYSEPHRRYHTMQHLEECFAVFDELKGVASDPVACELALWWHDAVYDTIASDNETRSAEMAGVTLVEAGTGSARIDRVKALILATKSHETHGDPDAAVVLDCDLAILGSTPERFAEYEKQIRAEYGWVPEFLYARKRSEVLEGFLKRERIYQTERGREEFDAAARENLRRVLGIR